MNDTYHKNHMLTPIMHAYTRMRHNSVPGLTLLLWRHSSVVVLAARWISDLKDGRSFEVLSLPSSYCFRQALLLLKADV